LNRLECVRQQVDRILWARAHDAEETRCGFVHLYGVALVAAMLAAKRGMTQELGAVAGMLHDISSYKTGDAKDHARLSAIEARTIMQGAACFSEEEVASVCDAIERHSNKNTRDGELAELLKDADVLRHHFYGAGARSMDAGNVRLSRLLNEVNCQ
jgi:uncharacterized protein